MLRDIYPGIQSSLLLFDFSGSSDTVYTSQSVAFGNTLYFAADAGTHGLALWRSDGTTKGTVMVPHIDPSLVYPWPQEFAGQGNQRPFSAADALHGRER